MIINRSLVAILYSVFSGSVMFPWHYLFWYSVVFYVMGSISGLSSIGLLFRWGIDMVFVLEVSLSICQVFRKWCLEIISSFLRSDFNQYTGLILSLFFFHAWTISFSHDTSAPYAVSLTGFHPGNFLCHWTHLFLLLTKGFGLFSFRFSDLLLASPFVIFTIPHVFTNVNSFFKLFEKNLVKINNCCFCRFPLDERSKTR